MELVKSYPLQCTHDQFELINLQTGQGAEQNVNIPLNQECADPLSCGVKEAATITAQPASFLL